MHDVTICLKVYRYDKSQMLLLSIKKHCTCKCMRNRGLTVLE